MSQSSAGQGDGPLPSDVVDELERIVSSRRRAAGYDIRDDAGRFSGTYRPVDSYRMDRSEARRIAFYRSRLDRLAMAVLGATLIVSAPVVLFMGGASAAEAIILFVVGCCLCFLVADSGRRGFLMKELANRVDDLSTSTSISAVRGHHRVHEAEQELVRRAVRESREGRRLLVMDLWTKPRPSVRTNEFLVLQKLIDDFSHRSPATCSTVVHVNGSDADFYRGVVLRRRDGAIHVIDSNPLQCDALLTDDEVIITFPRANANRSFAMRIRNKALVDEFWDVFGEVSVSSSAPPVVE